MKRRLFVQLITGRSRAVGLLAALALAVLAVETPAQIRVTVDATKAWQGYMNWFSLEDAYVGGSAWAIEDLRASFEPSREAATTVVIGVNTNSYDPSDPFWNNPDGSPAKKLEANFYVDVATEFAGNEVTFEGYVEANSLPAGWTCEAVIKEFGGGYAYIGDTRAALVPGQPFSVTRSIGGGNICQYGFLTYGPNAAPESPPTLESVVIRVDNSDPSITENPSDLRRPVGGSAQFSVVAVGQSAISYQWSLVQGGVTNPLTDGVRVSGATTDTLTLTDLQVADSGTYLVTAANLAGTASASAELAVKEGADYVNFLENGGFEADPTGQDYAPWQRFASSAPTAGYLQNADDEYLFGGKVNVHDGDWVSFTVFHDAWSGIYQDAAAEPGQIFTGEIWVYNASGDPIPGGTGSGTTNECYLEVQFRAGEDVLQQYVSEFFDYTLPRDTWIRMAATNAGDYGSMPPAEDATYLVAPEGTTKVRFQLTMHDIAGSNGQGSLYYDSARLMLKEPVALDVSESAGEITLGWPTLVETDYLVQSTDDPVAGTWDDEEVVAGTGAMVTRTYPATGPQRSYRVITQ